MAKGRKKKSVTNGEEGLFPEIHPARYGDNRRKQPLILPKLLKKKAEDFALFTDDQKHAHEIMIKWADLESSGKLQKMKETALQGEFISEVFATVLGYIRFSEDLNHWEIEEHYSLPSGQEADAAIGFFATEHSEPPTVLIELKGPKTNLDRDKSRGRTPVQQCWDYLNDVPGCPWGIVCNYVSFRLYHRNHTPQSYEVFTLQELRDKKRFQEFLTLLQREGLLREVLGQESRALRLLRESKDRQREVGRELYRHYHENRQELVGHLMGKPHNKSLNAAISIAQILLDRIIFIAFCEDRDLLPPKSIEKTWRDIAAFTVAQNPRWQNFLNLFQSIDKGNERFDISPFNGGLFKYQSEVDALTLDDRWTNFFNVIGSYDFKDVVTVDVLGYIFEQSITDLEALRADPTALQEPRKKVSGKRKREGVYYTPPQITRYIVENTLGPCIQDRFAKIAKKHKVDPQAEPDKKNLNAWLKCREEMLDSLRSLRVCDTSCGSGAFLIQAFDYLESAYEELILPLAKHGKQKEKQLLDDAKQAILSENLFGVDLSEEAVEIARLALWIRTAEKGKTLADLSDNIQCGNSIVDDPKIDPKALDWSERFKDVFEEGGFDCVISNPPYVKLQNFRKTNPEIAAYLVHRYRSAKTGNFDMYLPFIEHGLEILKPTGRLGFIAPNVWLFNEYGKGLRELVLEKRALERFVDFKSYQVFEDATTYTALQFFSKQARKTIKVIDAADGQASAHEPHEVSYAGLSSGAWALLPDAGRRLLEKMQANSVTLQEASGCIIVGIQTSADAIYHLIRLGPGQYYSRSLNKKVELEDEIMKPLISGEEAVPFAVPSTDKYLLFPYKVTATEYRLYTPREMARRFHRTWAYLRENEKALRHRENGKFDDEQWYRFGRHQNIGKQKYTKLLVPRLLLNLFASSDPEGKLYIDNVDVGGVIPAKGWDLYYLLGILNSRACGYVWRLTSKPFRGEYRSANKQFIAPLPIPNVKPKDQKPVAGLAKRLADLHGKRLEAFAKVRRRIIVDLSPPVLLETSPLPPKLPRKLEAFAEIPIAEVLSQLSKFTKRKLRPSEREQWDSYLTAEANAIAKINRKIDDLTNEMNERINTLYGLGKKEVKLIAESSP